MSDPGSTATVVKRSLTIAGHRTSISLEDAFWLGLQHAAKRRRVAVATLVAEIDRGRGGSNLSSAIRIFVLEQSRANHDPLSSVPPPG